MLSTFLSSAANFIDRSTVIRCSSFVLLITCPKKRLHGVLCQFPHNAVAFDILAGLEHSFYDLHFGASSLFCYCFEIVQISHPCNRMGTSVTIQGYFLVRMKLDLL